MERDLELKSGVACQEGELGKEKASNAVLGGGRDMKASVGLIQSC